MWAAPFTSPNMLFIFKKWIPKSVFSFFQPIYHWALAWMAAVFYGFPSRKLKVIGVTGTSGKTTTIEFLHEIFQAAGFKTASLSGLRFKILDKSRTNFLKMTMPGRFAVQKFLSEAKKAGCQYIFLEVTSEGIKQYRHKFINFYAAIFTNLSEEHLEAHGGFFNYRAAKAKLFQSAPVQILNADDPNFEFFNKISAKEKVLFRKSDFPADWQIKIPGEFNKMNAIAALALSRHEGISDEISKKALAGIRVMPGRMEFIDPPVGGRKNFQVLVDYAFLPQTLKLAYETAKKNSASLICVLGAAGGGRDKWKRPKLGSVAAENCRKVFITNEDPYDEDPNQILSEIKSGISNSQFLISNVREILDRREAIREAIKSAKPNDTVVITGKGAEPWIMGPNGTKVPWDDREVVREELKKL